MQIAKICTFLEDNIFFQKETSKYEYKKLHSLQYLVRTTYRTKTANITNDDVTFAAQLLFWRCDAEVASSFVIFAVLVLPLNTEMLTDSSWCRVSWNVTATRCSNLPHLFFRLFMETTSSQWTLFFVVYFHFLVTDSCCWLQQLLCCNSTHTMHTLLQALPPETTHARTTDNCQHKSVTCVTKVVVWHSW